MNTLTLTPGHLSFAQLRAVWQQPVQLRLDSSAVDGINASVDCVNNIVAEGRTAYGINTGFGLLAQTRIATEDLQNLQRSLVLSHAAGIGEPLDDAMVRLIMVLKINSLARGFSGIRLSVIEALIALVNAEVWPLIPAKGSVGASGDLAPLAHMSLTLLGEGKARWQGEWLPAKEALKKGWTGTDHAGGERGTGAAEWHPGLHRLCAAWAVRSAGAVRLLQWSAGR
ncbi:histidine ammonia-lyase [Citrobacter koseri]|uniref:Histidine ammonia-lyase n=1 Tax=Citrobacter koseri TaxID=545 RepID=A0A2X2UW82_CITKO|nr:histidine ammonia-lyase [Citrobacter koseri]